MLCWAASWINSDTSALPKRDKNKLGKVLRLGEEGMAIVYRAFDTHLDCEVAVNFFRIEQLAHIVPFSIEALRVKVLCNLQHMVPIRSI
jgi:hypothetical protein